MASIKSVEEATQFKRDIDSSRGALNRFSNTVGDFSVTTIDFNAAMLKVSTTLYTVNQRSGNIGKLTAALTAFTKIPDTAAKITGFASGAARELDAVATAMSRIAEQTQKTVSAIKSADLSGAMADTMRKAVREAADKASNDEKAYFAAAIGAMVSSGMKGVKYEGDGGAFKAMLQKNIAGGIEKFAKAGSLSRGMLNLAQRVEDAAEYIGPSVASGITRGQGEAVRSTVALGTAVEAALRDTLDVHSESPKFHHYRRVAALSVAAGIDKGTVGAVAAAHRSAGAISGALKAKFEEQKAQFGEITVGVNEKSFEANCSSWRMLRAERSRMH